MWATGDRHASASPNLSSHRPFLLGFLQFSVLLPNPLGGGGSLHTLNTQQAEHSRGKRVDGRAAEGREKYRTAQRWRICSLSYKLNALADDGVGSGY